jgi:hypothetical protein
MAIEHHIENAKEKSEAMASMLYVADQKSISEFTPAYIDAVFFTWYSKGKPVMRKLTNMLPKPSEFGIASGPPSLKILFDWYNKIFMERAAKLDAEVSRQLEEYLVAERVKMLEEHSKIALTMQNMAMSYLIQNPEKMNSNAAVRLLVEGIRVERESRGIPKMMEQLTSKSDEDLVKQIEDLLTKTETTFTPLEESVDDE